MSDPESKKKNPPSQYLEKQKWLFNNKYMFQGSVYKDNKGYNIKTKKENYIKTIKENHTIFIKSN